MQLTAVFLQPYHVIHSDLHGIHYVFHGVLMVLRRRTYQILSRRLGLAAWLVDSHVHQQGMGLHVLIVALNMVGTPVGTARNRLQEIN